MTHTDSLQFRSQQTEGQGRGCLGVWWQPSSSVSPHGRRGKQAPLGFFFFNKNTSLIHDLITSPQAPPPDITTLEISFQQINLDRDTNTEPIAIYK